MISLEGFNANNIDLDDEFEALPAGDYVVAITDSEVKGAKKNANNRMLKLTLQVIDGQHKGAKLFDNLNLWHSESETARKIATKTLAKICLACGKPEPNNAEALHGIPFRISVEVEQDGKYTRNNIKKYEPAGAQPQLYSEKVDPPTVQATVTEVTQQTPPSSNGAGPSPW